MQWPSLVLVRRQQPRYAVFLERKQLKQLLRAQYVTSSRAHCPHTAGSSPEQRDSNKSLRPSCRLYQLIIPGGSNSWSQVFVSQAQACWAIKGSLGPGAVLAGVEQKLGLVCPYLGCMLVEEVSFPDKLCWALCLPRCCWCFQCLLK